MFFMEVFSCRFWYMGWGFGFYLGERYMKKKGGGLVVVVALLIFMLS